ncbi:MAG: J domain-containing protein [Psychrobacter sp.]|nr:J domain-containing protein [Psychrobacter sp.]
MQLDCWQVLAIEPTDDESAIKRAYAAKLKHNKPDKNPDGFRELRAAYEEALAIRFYYADFEEDEDDDYESSGSQLQTGNQPHDAEPIISFDIALQNNTSPYTAITVIEDSQALDDNLQLADSREIANSLEPIPDWQQQWRHCEEGVGDGGLSADMGLMDLLQSQLKDIQYLPLDTQTEFEEQILIWLSEQPLKYPQSYQLIKANFKWGERLSQWDESIYPWFFLRALDSRYEQLLDFGTQAGFRRYLAIHYPLVYQHWELGPSNSDKGRPMSRWQFLRRFFIPLPALVLGHELAELETELERVGSGFEQSEVGLDSLTDSDISAATQAQSSQLANNPAEYWQSHPQLQTLRRWVLQRFIGWQDYLYLAVAIALIVAVIWGLDKLWLIDPHSWQYFVYDGLGVWIVLSIGLTVWQGLLKLYARPERFVIADRVQASNILWCATSAALWALFSSIWFESAASNQVGAPHEMSFYVAHLSAASLMLALTRRQDNLLLTHIMWYWLLILLCLTVIAPLLVLVSHNPALIDRDIVFYGPMCWLVVIIPLWLLELSYVNSIRELPFGLYDVIIKISEWLASLFILALLFAGYILWTNFGDILTTLNLGWSYFALIVLILTLGLILSQTVQAFDEMS